MSFLSIKDAPLKTTIVGDEKIPTGGYGDLAVTVQQIKDFTSLAFSNVDNTSDLDKPVSNATNVALSLKANVSDVDTSLSFKADKTYVDDQLALKASKIYVDTELQKTASKTYVDNQLATKASTTYVDSINANKANISYVDSELALKSDITYVDTSLTNKTHNSLVGRDVANAHPASAIADASGKTQQEINNGLESIAEMLAITNPQVGNRVFVKSFHAGLNLGGGDFVATSKPWADADDILVFKSALINICWVRTGYQTITPLMAGAIGDGVNDDTAGIQKCVNVATYVDMRYRNWKTTAKITIPSYRSFNLYGSNLSADNALEPIFEFVQAGEGLTILHGGGLITGTADSFLKCTGSTTTPTAAVDYARQIRLDGLYIASANIDKFLDFKDAVRQVFIDKVNAYTKNGISAVGKCVEVKATKSIIYGATNDLGTYGVKLQSPAGGSYYNEGFHFTDCTIDNFNTTFDVTDIYALSVTGGHIGRSVTGKVAVFGQPASTACRDIKFTGVNINGSVEFAPTGGRDYHAQFTGCVSESCDGINIHIKNNAASISISNHRFHTSINGVAVVCDNNNAQISISDINCDVTFISGVQIKGTNGSGCSVSGINYSGTGEALYIERPVRLADVPISALTKDYIQAFNAGSIQGSHIVGANITSVSNWFANGETGVIVCELTYTGASASQVLSIETPIGMSIPTGTGWSSGAIMLNTVDGRVSLAIPYIVTQDIPSGSITLKNDTGNTISLGYHSYFGFKRDC